jgi:hypothetical protein
MGLGQARSGVLAMRVWRTNQYEARLPAIRPGSMSFAKINSYEQTSGPE